MKKNSDNTSVYAHFIGVGGAGMSALALVLLQRGIKITGSDLKESRYTRTLQAAGMEVFIGHDAANVGNPEVVVISTAIPEEKNPELKEARRRNLPVWKRAQMLAEITKGITTVAVAGTHGKTSTSSMLANTLEVLGKDPGFCIGGEVDAFSANAREGSGELHVVEADESDGSFVWLSPQIAIITNLEPEHVDHYDSYDQLEQVFADFMSRVNDDGLLVVCGDDKELIELSEASNKKMLTYGAGPNCDIRYSNIKPFTGKAGSDFTIEYQGCLYPASITLPGEHMVSNATAVFAATVSLGIDPFEAAAALGSFQGVRRRFEFLGEWDGVSIVDDYGHHPTEIAVTLRGAKDLGYKRTVVVFQPHRYSRTQAFEREFGSAFDSADVIILTDIFSSGETPIPGVSGRTVVNSILNYDPDAQVVWLPRKQSLPDYLCSHTRPGDLLITMGAGDVTGVGPEFVREQKERKARSKDFTDINLASSSVAG
ncbi:MAG: UDP-N-acetylmuramate--L-alanine ligase [Coriobacteriia bacterium]|nr:UDP-N-acetylmuramate--L-alanine ligase [Coriobacteriia bacterium]MCL2745984.1 UDP-N-acetylmuramate--L-alanine ligase [Coriobacteriia bacterium]MCL2870196.1 UDP-N-acetylmuramate--L-alanine ligase [Coriobacteriia bacterium]